MKHYDYIEWLLYKNKMLPIEKLDEMEQHLFNCDTCMEIFLSLIDEEEVEDAGKFSNDNFAYNVIKNIPKLKISKSKAKQKRKIFNYQFGYYVAVASVTIILTLSGFYTDLVDTVPKLSSSIIERDEHPNVIANFSNGIVDSTSSFLFNIENIDRNKRRKNSEK